MKEIFKLFASMAVAGINAVKNITSAIHFYNRSAHRREIDPYYYDIYNYYAKKGR